MSNHYFPETLLTLFTYHLSELTHLRKNQSIYGFKYYDYGTIEILYCFIAIKLIKIFIVQTCKLKSTSLHLFPYAEAQPARSAEEYASFRSAKFAKGLL